MRNTYKKKEEENMTNIKNITPHIYKVITALIIVVIATGILFACAKKEKEEKEKLVEEPKIEYKANSPLGIAESYIGEPVSDLIEAVGTLKGDPVIEPTNDGGGYQGTYEFDGFTAYTYAKAEDAEAVVTEIVPDEESDVYKESIKTNEDQGNK